MSYADIFSELETDSDLGITLLGAALLHIVLILGLTFTLPKQKANDDPPQLEITLVQAHTEKQPDKADFLANTSQQGGGDTEKELQAKTPLPESRQKSPASTKISPTEHSQ